MARFVISIFIFVFCTDLRSAPRLDRLNLLQFRDAKGKIQTVKTTVDWELRRTEILKGMVAVMGPLPGKARRVRLDVKVVEEVDAGKYDYWTTMLSWFQILIIDVVLKISGNCNVCR